MSVYYPQCRAIVTVTMDNLGAASGLEDPVVFDVIPQSCSVLLNSYKEADTFDMTFDLHHLPISPEQIRNAVVQIYMYNLPHLGADERPFQTENKVKCIGIVDNAEMDATDASTFHITGRDYTCLLLDRQFPQKRITVGRPLDVTIQELCNEVTEGVGRNNPLIVSFEDAGPPPIVEGTIKSQKTKKRGITPQGKNYWDVIYDLCIRHGYICFVRGIHVMITRPHVLTLQANTSITHMVFGQNLKELHVERKMGKERVPQMIVRSYDSDKRKVIQGSYPRKGQKAYTGIGTEKDNSRSFTVPGIVDQSVLNKIAENAYNAIARGEGSMRFSTTALEDINGKSLLDLQSGDAIRASFESIAPDSVLGQLNAAQRLRWLTDRGLPFQVANLIANNYERLSYFRRPFYVSDVTLAWNNKSGITIDVDAKNFISEQRDDESSKEKTIGQQIAGDIYDAMHKPKALP